MRRILSVALAAATAGAGMPAQAQPAPWETPPPQAADLAQCYQWAKVQTETLHAQEEQIYQLRQQYKQVLGTALPNLNYNYSATYLDTPGAGSVSGGGASQSTFLSPQPQANFTLSQTLFDGFKEFAAMRSFKHQERSSRLQLQHAYASLYQDVSNAFYLIVNLEAQLDDIALAITMSESRIKELRSWVDLGKSRHSEVVLVESQKAAYEAQAEALKGQIEVARSLLSFLTGQDMSKTALLDKLERVSALDPEESVLALASSRTDVRSLREAVDAQQALVKAAEAAWYPTANLAGDYYDYRIAFYRPIHWDATVTINLPIFQGGSSLASLRQAKSQVSQAQYNFEFGLRQARSQIQSAYATLRASVAQSLAAEKSYGKADESYRLDQKEYRLGLVTNLDVLTALNAVLSAKLIYDQTVIQSKLNLLLLKVADEELPGP
jgi:outer membrane protein